MPVVNQLCPPKEAQAAPSPAPIGFMRGGCGSYTHVVCKICPCDLSPAEAEILSLHSEVAWGVQYSVDFTTTTTVQTFYAIFCLI
jgi:hypothetical protein